MAKGNATVSGNSTDKLQGLEARLDELNALPFYYILFHRDAKQILFCWKKWKDIGRTLLQETQSSTARL